MAIVVTSIGTNNVGPSGGSFTISATVPAGATIVVCWHDNGTAGANASVSDAASNTYTLITSQTLNNLNSAGKCGIYYIANCAALSTQNITITSSGSNSCGASAFQITGLASAPLDSTVTAVGFGSGAAPTVTAANAPATANSLIVGFVAYSGVPTFTQDSTHAAYANVPVAISSSGRSLAGGNVVSSSKLTYAPSLTGINSWADIIIGFKPLASASVTGVAGASHAGTVTAQHSASGSISGISAFGLPVADYVRNKTASGAVAGTLGSGGSAPTNWSVDSSPAYMTHTVVGTGTESGIPYIDFSVSGTVTDPTILCLNLTPDGAYYLGAPISASQGQTWTLAYYLRLISGSIPSDVLAVIIELDGSGNQIAYDNSGNVGTPTTAALSTQRYSQTSTLGQATTTSIMPALWFYANNGQVVSFTVRIGQPSLTRTSSLAPTSPPLIANPGGNVTGVPGVGTGPFSRGSVATYVNGQTMVQVAANIPRPIFESFAATNIITNSTTLAGSSYGTASPNTMADSTDVPALLSGAKVYKNTLVSNVGDNNVGFITTGILPSNNTTYYCSMWVWIPLSFTGSAVQVTGEQPDATIDNPLLTTANMSLRNQWQRISGSDILGSSTITNALPIVLRLYGAANGDYVYSTCWQVEVSNSTGDASSFVPTSGAIATRAAESYPSLADEIQKSIPGASGTSGVGTFTPTVKPGTLTSVAGSSGVGTLGVTYSGQHSITGVVGTSGVGSVQPSGVIQVYDIGTATTSSSSAATLATPGAIDSLIFVVFNDAGTGNTVPTISDTNGSTYTVLATWAGINNNAKGIAYTNLTGTGNGPGVISVTPSGGFGVVFSAFYAVNTSAASNPFDSATVATVNSTTPSVTSGTPTRAGEQFIGIALHENAATSTMTQDATWFSPPIRSVSGAHNGVFFVGGANKTDFGTGTLSYAPTFTNTPTVRSYIVGVFPAISLSGAGTASGSSAASATGSANFSGVGSASGTSSATALAGSIGSASGTSTASASYQPVSVGTASGSASDNFIGASTAASVATDSGNSTASATGSAQDTTVGSASGSSTASATGVGNFLAIGTASGTESDSFIGAANFAASGAASGGASCTATGAVDYAAAGSASGTSSASASASSTATSVATASGTESDNVVGAANFAGVGSASGSESDSFVGASTATTVGSASGSSTASGVGASITGSQSVGSAAGTSTASAVSHATAASEADASGTCDPEGVGASHNAASGSASGSSSATATSAYLIAISGSATGNSIAAAIGAALFKAVASASGSSTATGASGLSGIGTGSATGSSSADGVGLALVSSAGTALGTSDAEAVGDHTITYNASAAGTSSAFGIGEAAAYRAVSASGTSTAHGVSETSISAIATADGTSDAVGYCGSAASAEGTSTASATIRYWLDAAMTDLFVAMDQRSYRIDGKPSLVIERDRHSRVLVDVDDRRIVIESDEDLDIG
jgi:hypothetical protein